jgi:hypothetical protein
MTWVGVPNPIYSDFLLLKDAVVEAQPHLTLITTQAEWLASFMSRGSLAQSNIPITMSNSDNQMHTARCSQFVNRPKMNLNKADRAIAFEKFKVTCGGTYVRESESIEDLTAYFVTKGLTLVCLTHEVETGTADAYFQSEDDLDDTFVGCQLTRGTVTRDTASSERNEGHCNICKSKEEIVNLVLVRHFLFVAMIYVNKIWCGVIFFTPDDAHLIHSLPNFKLINVSMGKGGFRTRKFQNKSICATLENANRIFLWEQGSSPPAAWMQIVQSFLKNPIQTKYSIQQFKLMLERNHYIEHMYIEGFKTIFPDTKRLAVGHEFGDAVFTVEEVDIEAEFKLVKVCKPAKNGSDIIKAL